MNKANQATGRAFEHSGLERRLAEALRRRAESEPVVVPDISVVTGTARARPPHRDEHHRTERRGWSWRWPASVAAASVIIGAASVAIVRTSDTAVDLETVAPSTTAVPTGDQTTEDPPADDLRPSGQGASLPDAPRSAEVDPRTLREAPPLEWRRFDAPPGEEGQEFGQFEGAVGDQILYRSNGLWRWSPDGGWVEVALPEGQRLEQVTAGGDGDPLVATWDIGGRSGWRFWALDDRFELVDPMEVRLPELPSQANDNFVSQGVNSPLAAGDQSDLYVAQSYGPRLDLEGLLNEAGLMTADQRFCDIGYEERRLVVTVSASATTDRECQSADDRETFLVGAEELGISEEELDIELGPGDTGQLTRTVIYRISNGGTAVTVHDMPGLIDEIVATDELGVVVTTVRSYRPTRSVIAHQAPGETTWAEQEVDGMTTLTTSVDLGVLVVHGDDTSLTVTGLSPTNGVTVDRLDEPWQPMLDDYRQPGHTGAFMYDTEPSLEHESWGLAVATADGRWSLNTFKEQFGVELGRVAISDSAVVVAAVPLFGDGRATLYWAPLPGS